MPLAGLKRKTKNERTGEPYTNADIARMSLGDLTEEEVEGIRNGTISDPSIAQVTALANVFGVQPSYFLDSGKKPPLIDSEAIEILRDETVSAIAHKCLALTCQGQADDLEHHPAVRGGTGSRRRPRCYAVGSQLWSRMQAVLGRRDHGRMTPETPSHSSCASVHC